MARRIRVLCDELFGDAVRLVFALAFFVLHHTALQIELFLVENAQQMAHTVAFGEQHIVKHGGRHVFKIIGAVVAGSAVQVGGTDALHRVDVGVIKIVTAAEHQVLEQVGKAGFPRLLVLRSHVVPGVHSHDGGLVVLMNKDGQAIVEYKLGVGDIRDGNLRV